MPSTRGDEHFVPHKSSQRRLNMYTHTHIEREGGVFPKSASVALREAGTSEEVKIANFRFLHETFYLYCT